MTKSQRSDTKKGNKINMHLSLHYKKCSAELTLDWSDFPNEFAQMQHEWDSLLVGVLRFEGQALRYSEMCATVI